MNKLNFESIMNIIDNRIKSQRNIMFICGLELADFITDYIQIEYDFEDEENSLNECLDEYYVSLYFDDEEVSYFVESARGNNGEFKLSDIDTDYFIQEEIMSEYDVDKNLLGGNCTWNWFELEDVDNEEEECDCLECQNDELVKEYTELIKDTNGCEKCIGDVLRGLIFEVTE